VFDSTFLLQFLYFYGPLVPPFSLSKIVFTLGADVERPSGPGIESNYENNLTSHVLEFKYCFFKGFCISGMSLHVAAFIKQQLIHFICAVLDMQGDKWHTKLTINFNNPKLTFLLIFSNFSF